MMVVSRVTSCLFGIGLAVMPFTGLPGPSFLGEVRHEVSVYFFLAALLFHVGSVLTALRAQCVAQIFPLSKTGYGVFIGGLLGAIFLSFAFNFSAIYETYYQGRWGMEKFISSFVLLVYGLSLSFLAYGIAGEREWSKILLRPLLTGVGICFFYSIFEVAAWFSEDAARFYTPLSDLVHAGFDPLAWDGRLRAVAFEAPDFANYAGYVWPWLLAATMGARGASRLGIGGLFVALNGMILLSQTRTSFVVVAGLVLVLIALRFIYLPPRVVLHQAVSRRMISGFLGLIALLAVATFFYGYDLLVVSVVEGDRVSNISRLASITAALRMFADRPLFGFGFGQFGFHLASYVPSWGLSSWEVRSWIADALNAWPASYSVYARLGADLGIVGVVAWIAAWLGLVYRLIRESLVYQTITGIMPLFAYPLVASCFGVLLNGVSSDSLRAPMIWITLGFAIRYIQTTQEAVSAAGHVAQSPKKGFAA